MYTVRTYKLDDGMEMTHKQHFAKLETAMTYWRVMAHTFAKQEGYSIRSDPFNTAGVLLITASNLAWYAVTLSEGS